MFDPHRAKKEDAFQLIIAKAVNSIDAHHMSVTRDRKLL